MEYKYIYAMCIRNIGSGSKSSLLHLVAPASDRSCLEWHHLTSSEHCVSTMSWCRLFGGACYSGPLQPLRVPLGVHAYDPDAL